MDKLLFLLFCLFSCITGQAQDNGLKYPAPENTRFRIIGYVPGYRDVSQIPDETLSRMDIACYAFATIDSTGFPVVRDEKQMKKFVKRVRKLGVEVMISFNGKHAVFSKMASDPVLRKRFTDEIWRIVKKYRLSGVDNDWEFPRTTDGTMESNLQLMKDLAELCRGGKKQYYLTMAVTSGMYPGARDAAITDEVFALVDWFNVMVYGNFSETKPGQHHSTYRMLEMSYDYWVKKRGLDPRKYVMGLPLYGLASGLPKKTSSTSFSKIMEQNGTKALGTDVAYVTNSIHTAPYPVYYNGIPTISRKTAFALDKRVGGVMFWEISQDAQGENSLVKTVCDIIEAAIEYKKH